MISAALSLALLAAPLPAGSPPRQVSFGYSSCVDWARSHFYSTGVRRTDEWTRKQDQWVWGYLEAFRRYGHPRRKIEFIEEDPIWGRIDAYCAAHPETTLVEAVNIEAERLRHQPLGKPHRPWHLRRRAGLSGKVIETR